MSKAGEDLYNQLEEGRQLFLPTLAKLPTLLQGIGETSFVGGAAWAMSAILALDYKTMTSAEIAAAAKRFADEAQSRHSAMIAEEMARIEG